MEIRTLTVEQVPAAIKLVEKVYNTAFVNGIDSNMDRFFMEYIEENKLRERVSSGEVMLFGAYEGEELAGVAGLHRPGQITLLYVDVPYLHMGVAKNLMLVMELFAKQVWNVREISANVFPTYNVKMFQKFGFSVKNGAVINGIYLPMVKRTNPYAATKGSKDFTVERKKFHWKGSLIALLVIILLFIGACALYTFYYFHIL